MSVSLTKRPISVKEYHQMEETGILGEHEKVELIIGEIVTISPAESRHAAISDRINHWLQQKSFSRVIVRVQSPVIISDLSEPEPDIAVLKPRENFYADAHPGPNDVLLIIEVADSSAGFDREVKLPLFAQAGIPEVWLIDLNQNRIEVYKNPDKVYKQVEYKLPGDRLSADFIEEPMDVKDLILMPEEE